MKHFSATLLFLVTLVNVHAQLEPCSELFISEFLEGDLLNKAVEIYNPKDESVNLEGYTLSVYANGATEATFTYEFSGSLPAYHTYVVCNPGSLQVVLDIANATSDVCSFNGNDALVLAYNGSPVDIIGVVGEDPQGPWAVGEGATENYTLVRKSSVQAPSLEWTESMSQWDVNPEDTISELGEHASVCNPNLGVFVSSVHDFIVMYPNPFEQQITLKGAILKSTERLIIRDLNSSVVCNQGVGIDTDFAKLDLAHLNQGVYIIEFVVSGNILREFIVKQ
jgi:predicted extracellular nuclease